MPIAPGPGGVVMGLGISCGGMSGIIDPGATDGVDTRLYGEALSGAIIGVPALSAAALGTDDGRVSPRHPEQGIQPHAPLGIGGMNDPG